jgi:hypothetical protein
MKNVLNGFQPKTEKKQYLNNDNLVKYLLFNKY